VWASQIIKTICLELLDSAPVLFQLIFIVIEKGTNTAKWFTKIVMVWVQSPMNVCFVMRNVILISEATPMISS
jgi:hypothetical protein